MELFGDSQTRVLKKTVQKLKLVSFHTIIECEVNTVASMLTRSSFQYGCRIYPDESLRTTYQSLDTGTNSSPKKILIMVILNVTECNLTFET